MKRYHGVSPLEQKRSMPAWLAKPSFVIGLLIVLVVILMALFPQFIAPYDPIATDVTVSNQAPSAAHWFGTDFYGRDIFSRVIWGTRIDLLIGVLGVVIPFLVGGMIGLLAGYYGGFLATSRPSGNTWREKRHPAKIILWSTSQTWASEHLLLYIQIRLHWHTAQRTNMYYIRYRRTYGELLRFLQRRISNYPMEMS